MADPIRPGFGGGDSDRGLNPSEPLDPTKLEEAADEPIHADHEFPGGGGSGGTPDPEVALGDEVGGSTGRDATDAGKTDATGQPGGGMAGSAGG